jgi:hypothetical protein
LRGVAGYGWQAIMEKSKLRNPNCREERSSKSQNCGCVQGSPRPFTAASVQPGVHDDNDEDDKPNDQQQNDLGFVLPNLAKSFGECLEVHAP